MKDTAVLSKILGSYPGASFDWLSHQTLGNGVGQASSQKIQFNINFPAPAQIVPVRTNQPAILVASLSSDHLFTKGWVIFDPTGSWSEDWSNGNPRAIESYVVVSEPITENKEIKFSIGCKGLETYQGGIVTLSLFVQYLPAA